MNILAIDTSNETLGVAIHDGTKTIVEYIANSKTKHSKRLMPAIDQVMKDADLVPKDLSKIVVAKGPGSYTGVRIGLSTAKTLAWTLKIPIVGISSLEVLASSARNQIERICPFFDARRGLVYTGLYQTDPFGQLQLIKQEQNILLKDWLDELAKEKKSIMFLSPDMLLHREAINEMLKEYAIIPDSMFHTPRPGALAVLGKDRESENVHQLAPNYLRMVEAEAKWLEKQKELGND